MRFRGQEKRNRHCILSLTILGKDLSKHFETFSYVFVSKQLGFDIAGKLSP